MLPLTNKRALLTHLAALTLAWICMSCGAALKTVKRGPHHQEQKAIQVDEPAPSARIERIPLQRDADCRWLDGYWERSERTWQWVRGHWVYPPKGCYFAPPETSFEQEAIGLVLNYRPAVWYPSEGQASCPAVKNCN